MQVPIIVDIIKTRQLDPAIAGRPTQDVARCEDAMGVEADLGAAADRETDVERAAGLQHPEEVRETAKMAVRHDWISVTTEPEVFQRMEAGDRVSNLRRRMAFLHQVSLQELDIRMARLFEWTHVHDFDHPERGDMGDKTVDS